MSSAQDAALQGARPASSTAGLPSARRSGRSSNKVCFKDKYEERKYRDRRHGSSSSRSDTSHSDSSSLSDSSSRSSASRSGGHGDRSRGRREHHHDNRRNLHSQRRHRDQPQRRARGPPPQGNLPTCSSSATALNAASGLCPAAAGGPAPPAPLPAAHPQLVMHPQQGMILMGSSFPSYPLPLQPPPHQQQQPTAALPCLALPATYPSSPSPVTTPTKAYTSPTSAADPPAPLLMSQYAGSSNYPATAPYGSSPGFCMPAASAAAAAAGSSVPPHYAPVPGSPLPGCSLQQQQPLPPPPQQPYPCASLLGPMQMLALNGGMQAHGSITGTCHGPGPGCVTATGVLPPLSLPILPPPPLAAQQHAAGLNMLYDETTQEVVLADAVMTTELAKQGHALTPLQDAYRTKLAGLQAAVNGQLLAKREALLQQHAKLAARAGEVAARRTALERDVAVLAEDMLGRLRSAESLKQALLGREQAAVGGQLEAVQRLLADIVAASAAGPVDFLNAYRQLTDTCARLVARPFKTDVEVVADDLPAEAAVYGELSAAHAALTKLLVVKDQMISHLLQERDALQDELRQVVERYTAELEALDGQSQRYFQRLLAVGAAEAEDGEDSSQRLHQQPHQRNRNRQSGRA